MSYEEPHLVSNPALSIARALYTLTIFLSVYLTILIVYLKILSKGSVLKYKVKHNQNTLYLNKMLKVSESKAMSLSLSVLLIIIII